MPHQVINRLSADFIFQVFYFSVKLFTSIIEHTQAGGFHSNRVVSTNQPGGSALYHLNISVIPEITRERP